MYCRAVRALQEPGRAPSSLLLCRYLWREDQQIHYLLPGLRRLNAQRCAVLWKHVKLPPVRAKSSNAASHELQGRQSAPGARQIPLQPVIVQFPVESRVKSLFNLPDLKSSMPSRTISLLCCAVAALEAAFRASTTKAAYRNCMAVRVLQEPGSDPCSLFLVRYL